MEKIWGGVRTVEETKQRKVKNEGIKMLIIRECKVNREMVKVKKK